MENQDWQLYAVHDEEQIAGFFGQYRFLSNFQLCPVMYEGWIYPSTENCYQAAKIVQAERGLFLHCTPAKSKSLWKEDRFPKLYTPEQWAKVKYDVMLTINLDKYLRNEDLLKLLLDTGNKNLEERNSWRDTDWGTHTDGNGQNNLGKILMNLRRHLRTHKQV